MTEYSTYILDKTEGSLRLILEDAFKKYWNMDAYTDHGTDIHYTYETLAKEVLRLHDFYRANGIMPGDKVVILSLLTKVGELEAFLSGTVHSM